MINPIAKLYRRVVEYLTLPARSPHWPEVRKKHLEEEGWCRSCAITSGLEVHHIIPFHTDQTRELDDNNLITLCENIGIQCHLRKGHFGNWKDINPDIRAQATAPKP